MRRFTLLRTAIPITLFIGVCLAFGLTRWQTLAVTRPGPTGNGDVRLNNGWTIHPVGFQTELNDMPCLQALAPDGKRLIVGTTGWHAHTLSVFDIGERSASAPDGRDHSLRTEPISTVTVPNLWRGIAFGVGEHRDELYVSGGSSHVVWRFRYDAKSGQLRQLDPFKIPSGMSWSAFPGGLGVLPDGSILVVDENADKGPTHADILYRLDPEAGAILSQVGLSPDAGALAISPNGDKVYVAEHGTGKVIVLSGKDLSRLNVIGVGVQPNAMLCDHHGRLFCANTGSDTVSVIDTVRDALVSTIRTALTQKSPLGSVPNSLGLSSDETTLYVTNGGNNDVAVVGLAKDGNKVKGFIPTGWYPVSVTVSPKNDWLFIGVGKGFRAFSNLTTTSGNIAYQVGQLPGQAYGPKHDRALIHDYIMSGLRGGLTRLAPPTEHQLTAFTRLAISVTPYRDSLLTRTRPTPLKSVLPDHVSDHPPFDHVLYIIKENRTYDQVFGDLTKGDGDPNLVLYGRNVTPNHHAIAEQFVLLDNLYCDGEVSQDGWEWSTAANDSDWDIKATTNSYSGRGDPPGSRETIRPSNGYLWEWAEKKGLTYFSYGAKTFAGLFSPTWKGHFSQEWNDMRKLDVPDYLKADLFVRDMHAAEKTGNWPNLVVMSLADDHTAGTRLGSRTPYASVCSNDLAVGKIVDAVTRSRFWPRTAIFVIEDDAQNGPDHVDAHRTVGLVVSPYTARGSVDHTMYTSSSFVRSIELCLGLPPESQYDAAAMPCFASFGGPKDLRPYRFLPARVDLTATNRASAAMSQVSAKMDFSDVDLANWDTLNRVLWADARPGTPYPGSFSSYTGR